MLKVPGQPYRPCLVIVDEAAELSGLGDGDQLKTTQANLSSLARLSRFVGMICAFATQRPDVRFLSGETKANLGIRVLYGSGGPTLTNMVLEIPLKQLSKLTDTCRGRGRAVITEGTALEFQGGFISPRSVKALRGVLGPHELTPVRFTKVPEWRSLLWAGTSKNGAYTDVLKHPDYDHVAAQLDHEIEESDAAILRGIDSGETSEPAPMESSKSSPASWGSCTRETFPAQPMEESLYLEPHPGDEEPPDIKSIDPMKYL